MCTACTPQFDMQKLSSIIRHSFWHCQDTAQTLISWQTLAWWKRNEETIEWNSLFQRQSAEKHCEWSFKCELKQKRNQQSPALNTTRNQHSLIQNWVDKSKDHRSNAWLEWARLRLRSQLIGIPNNDHRQWRSRWRKPTAIRALGKRKEMIPRHQLIKTLIAGRNKTSAEAQHQSNQYGIDQCHHGDRQWQAR